MFKIFFSLPPNILLGCPAIGKRRFCDEPKRASAREARFSLFYRNFNQAGKDS